MLPPSMVLNLNPVHMKHQVLAQRIRLVVLMMAALIERLSIMR